MKLSSIRSFRLIAFVVALLLVGLAFYPGMLASPYEPLSHQYSHAVTPESSESFEQHSAEFDPPVREYDTLSPDGQDLFDRTRAEPANKNSDWHRYTPNVCRPEMIVCDGVHIDDLPTEFTYGEDLEPSETSTIIVDGDDRYLLRTGSTSHADTFLGEWIDGILTLVTLVPLGLFVAAVAAKAGSKRMLVGLSLAGGTVAALGLLAPYIEMFTSISVATIQLSLFITIWLGFAIAGSYTIYTELTRTRGLG